MGIYEDMAEFLSSDIPGEFRVRVPNPPGLQVAVKNAAASLAATLDGSEADHTTSMLAMLLAAVSDNHQAGKCGCIARMEVDQVCLYARNLAISLAGT